MGSYSTTLFNSIFAEINKCLIEKKCLIKKNISTTFNGLWAFSYLKGANSFKTAFFINRDDITITNEIRETIDKAIIDCDHGSLGKSFKTLQNSTEITDLLNDTFDDPIGVVCYLDTQIKQQHAVFVLIQNDNDGNEILGMLDLFFSGPKIDVDGALRKKIDNLFIDEKFKRLCVNTFKIHQFENIIKNETEIGQQTITKVKTSKFQHAINKIEKYIIESSVTPIFYFSSLLEPIVPELVGVNLNYILDIVNHEFRFCSFIANKPNCYFSDPPDSADCCYNPFLNLYYYRILNQLKCKLVKHDFSIHNIK